MSIQRSAAAVLTLLLALSAGEARAQYSEGNVDNDGFQVPTFPVPGGSVSISNSGEGMVSVPLAAPPGVLGMAPTLSLRYSSAGEDIGLGKGFTLDLGFPDAIRRATRFGVPAYGDPGSTSDVFTFAGQDLVPVGSSRYKTRIDDFRLIEWAGGHWVVREKNGARLVYGETAAEQSAVTPGSGPCTTCVYAWHLSTVVDTYGNTIAFSYEPLSGPSPDSVRLKSIAYGVAGGRAQSVVLEWEGREDARRDASNGAIVVHDARLDRIEMLSAGALVRTYDLTYADATARRLTAVQQTGADGTAPPGWAFAYSDHDGHDVVNSGKLPTVNGKEVLFVQGSHSNGSNFSDGGVRAADVNGDGLVDLVAGLNLNGDNWVLLNTGAGWGNTPAPGWTLPHPFVIDDIDQGTRLVDVNGDGLPDVVRSRNGTPAAVYMNTGQGWGPANAGYQLPAELPPLVGGGRRVGSYDYGVRFADVNGDGLTDLLHAQPGRGTRPAARAVYLNDGQSGWVRDTQWTEALWSPDLPADYFFAYEVDGEYGIRASDSGLRLIDINSDGLSDLVFGQNLRKEVCLNNGRGWDPPGGWEFPEVFVVASFIDVSDNMVNVVDLDGDGFLDVILNIEDGVPPNKVYLNNRVDGFIDASSDFTMPEPLGLGSAPSAGAADAGTRIFDVNGDGVVDVVRGGRLYDGTPVNAIHLRAAGSGSSRRITDLVARYTNPLGGTATLEYASTHGLGLPAGQMPFVRTVARSLTQDAGLGDPALVQQYEYQQGQYDWRRRELRGYARVIETQADGRRAERSFYLDEGRRGISSGEMLRDADGQYYSAHPRNYTTSADANGVYRTLLANELVVQFHQDDQSQWVRRSIDYTYDEYGNLRTTRESDWGRTERVCGPLEKQLVARASGVRAQAEPPPEDCWDEFRPGPVLRSTRTSYASPNPELWTVGLVCAVERFEGDLLTAGNTPRATEEVYYEDNPARCASASQNRVTKTTLVDHKLAGLTLASGGAAVSKSYRHDAYGNVTEETDGQGHSTTVDFAGNGHLFPHTTCRAGLCQTTVYDLALGLLTEATDANAQTTRNHYDGLGRLRFRSYPGDPPEDPGLTVSYQLARLPVYMTVTERLDADRSRMRFEVFDGLGRAKRKAVGTWGDWVVSGRTEYDDRGRPARVYEPYWCQGEPENCLNGPTPLTTYSYEDDKLSTTVLPGGESTRRFYPAEGIYHTDEHGVRAFRRYDGLGRLTEVTTDVDGSGTTHKTTRYSYDGLGRLTSSVDPVAEGGRGVETRYFYDAWGHFRGLTSPDGNETPRNQFQVWNDYDAAGNQTHHWAGNDVWRASYDALDRRTWLYVSRDGGTTWKSESEYRYDEGSLQTTARTSKLNRATVAAMAAGSNVPAPVVPYTRGRLTSVVKHGLATAANPQSRLSYDARGRVTKEEFQNYDTLNPGIGTSLLSLEYQYDRDDKVIAIKDPRGRWTRYSRNLLGQIARWGGADAIRYNDATAVPSLSYDPSGRVQGVTFASGEESQLEYDWRGRVTMITGTGPLQASYLYLRQQGDLPGLNLSHSTEILSGRTIDRAYLYDNLHRLKTAKVPFGGPAFDLSYGYDASGNLLTVSGTGAPAYTYQIAAGRNRLASVTTGGQTLTPLFDSHGNLTELGAARYSYDAFGRLSGYQAAGVSGLVDYDGRGRKLRRTFGGGTEVYVYTTWGQVLATYKTSAGWTSYLLADGKRMGSVDQADQLRFFHADQLGSTRAITDLQRHVVWSADYLPFGAEINSTGSGDNFRFTGQELDPGLGLYDYGARYYDPQLRRFLQLDSNLGDATDPRTLNRYSYTLNNPLSFVDPDGESATLAGALAGALWGAGSSLVKGAITGQMPSAREVLAAAAGGAVSGALMGSVVDTGGATLLVAGALSGAAGTAVENAVLGKTTTAGEFVASAALGAVSVGLAKPGMVPTLSKAAASRGVVVLGETPSRVEAAASKLGADTFSTPWTNAIDVMNENMSWLKGQIESGARIFDIGFDVARDTVGKFYLAEQKFMRSMGFVQQFVRYIEVNGQRMKLYEWVRPATPVTRGFGS